MSSLRIVVPENIKKIGDEVNRGLKKISGSDENYIVRPELVRFKNGEGKCTYQQYIQNGDLYLLSDVLNDSITYDTRNGINHMSPDEHYRDVMRMISATVNRADRITLVLPYMYQSRQDKISVSSGQESLDLAMTLRELSGLGVKELITADVHNKYACDNAANGMIIDNFYCSDDIILRLLDNEDFDVRKLVVASPDFGASSRAKFYADTIGNLPFGIFHKVRNREKVKDGTNEIQSHTFLFNGDLNGKNVIIPDDMIDSGGSMIDSARKLKAMGTENIYLIATFGLFSKGSRENFDAAYDDGIFKKLYITNLNYVPEEILSRPWIEQVNCSEKIARIIYRLHNGMPIQDLLKADEQTVEKIREKVRQKKRG